jgi:hypothetical protein
MAGNPKPVVDGLPGYTPIIIKLDWPDMSTPAMTAADWKWLTGRIRAIRRPLHVSCAMGHGRTGTCLALLAHFYGQIPRDADPVQWVRDKYCSEAIETLSQIRYVERITGRASKCKAKEPLLSQPGAFTGYSMGGGYTSGGYGAEYGTKWDANKRSEKPSSYFPENDASKALATGKYGAPETRALVRYCGQVTKGILCPKPARADQILCNRHFYESLPEQKERTENGLESDGAY